MPTSGSGTRPPTIADVAKAAAVSRTTVSHALNGLGKVDPRTRERIKKIAADLGYRPNLRAQRLRRGQAKAIALVSSMPFAVAGGPSRLGFYMEVAAAAAERALVHDYALVLVPPVQSGSALYSLDIDGAIVVEPDENDMAVAQLRERHLPYVALGRPVSPEDDAPYVDLPRERIRRRAASDAPPGAGSAPSGTDHRRRCPPFRGRRPRRVRALRRRTRVGPARRDGSRGGR